MNWISKISANALSVILTAYLLPGVEIRDFLTALLVALVLAFLNFILKPILIIVTIPVTVLTLGLFLLVINAFIIILASDLVDGFFVSSFWWALLFSLILSFLNSIFEKLGKDPKPDKTQE